LGTVLAGAPRNDIARGRSGGPAPSASTSPYGSDGPICVLDDRLHLVPCRIVVEVQPDPAPMPHVRRHEGPLRGALHQLVCTRALRRTRSRAARHRGGRAAAPPLVRELLSPPALHADPRRVVDDILSDAPKAPSAVPGVATKPGERLVGAALESLGDDPLGLVYGDPAREHLLELVGHHVRVVNRSALERRDRRDVLGGQRGRLATWSSSLPGRRPDQGGCQPRRTA
jgi:hypothetical protein